MQWHWRLGMLPAVQIGRIGNLISVLREIMRVKQTIQFFDSLCVEDEEFMT